MRTIFYLILWLIMLYILLIIGIVVYVFTLSFHQLLSLLYFLEYGDPSDEDHEEQFNLEFKQKQNNKLI